MIRHSLISVSNSEATSIDIADSIKSSFTLVIQNINTTGYIYIGNGSVSATNYGFRISPNQAFTIELSSSEDMYALASEAGMSVAVMEISRAI